MIADKVELNSSGDSTRHPVPPATTVVELFPLDFLHAFETRLLDLAHDRQL
jgi:hypothetical protein